MIGSVLESDNLLVCPHLAGIADESQESETTAQDNIRDTNEALVQSRSLVDSYRPLAFSSALIFDTAQRLSAKFQYRTFRLKCFQELLTSLLAAHKHSRPPDDPAACHKHVVQIERRLRVEVHRRLRLCMFQRHHILLPLLLALEQLVVTGEISSHEYTALGEDTGSLEHQLQVLNTSDTAQKPAWLSHQVSTTHTLTRSLIMSLPLCRVGLGFICWRNCLCSRASHHQWPPRVRPGGSTAGRVSLSQIPLPFMTLHPSTTTTLCYCAGLSALMRYYGISAKTVLLLLLPPLLDKANDLIFSRSLLRLWRSLCL